MSDAPDPTAVPPATPPAMPQAGTAGGLLRQARQAQGLHIAALAAAIKVVPRKLELLESDQYDQLPDATFTRALAQAVCRTLKVDAKPVLALLPPPNGHRLEQVSEGLNTPFHERPGRFVPRDWFSMTSPALWLAVLLVVGAALIYALPAGWSPVPAGSRFRVGASAPAASPASAADGQRLDGLTSQVGASLADPSASVALVGEPVAAGSPASAAVGAVVGAPPVEAGVLQVRTTGQSWVEVVDARGRAVLGRLVLPGETVGLDGPAPFKVRIGNAAATALVFRGRPVALEPFTRDNVARLELK